VSQAVFFSNRTFFITLLCFENISAERIEGYKTREIIGKNFGPSRTGISRQQPAFYITHAFTQGAAVCNRRINKRRLQSAAP